MAIIVGSVGVEVVPDAQRFATLLRGQIATDAGRVGDEVGKAVAKPIVDQVAKGVGDGLERSKTTARGKGEQAGNDFGGAFARTVKDRVEAALKALPKAQIDADTGRLDERLADVRARLEALRDAHIGVDLDGGQALAEISALKLDIDELGAKSADVAVHADAARALAELSAVQVEVDRLDGRTANVNVRVNESGGAGGGLLAGLFDNPAGLALAGGAALFAPVAAAGAITAGVGAATGLGAGLAGLGATKLALGGVSDALKAVQKENAETGKAAAASGGRQASAALAVQGAQEALANTIASTKDAQIRAAEQVANARLALADAQRQAAQGVQQALRQQQSAEQSLETAQRSELDAQRALTQARKDAQQQLEDLANQQTDANLAVRQGQFDVKDASAALATALASGNDDQIARAQLAYDQAVQRLKELQLQQQRVSQARADADKKGVNGSDLVVAAQQQVIDATSRVQQAQQNLGDAAKAVDEARRQGAESVAKAEQGVSEALRNQVSVARDSAFQIAQARRALASAQLSQASSGGSAGPSASQLAAQSALAKLTPQGREFVRFLQAEFLPEIDRIKRTAQANLLPGLEEGLKAVKPLLPGINTLVANTAGAVGDLASKAGKALQDPFWKGFIDDLSKNIGPAIETVGQILGDLATGFAGLFDAFLPQGQSFGETVKDLTDRFAKFGTTLDNNPQFQKFLKYVQDNGPQFLRELGLIIELIAKTAAALAPLSSAALTVATAITRFLLAALDGAGLSLREFVSVALKTIGAFLDGVSTSLGILGKLPGPLGKPFREAQDAIDRAKRSVDGLATSITDLVKYPHDIKVSINGKKVALPVDARGQAYVPTGTGGRAVLDVPARAGGGPVAVGMPYTVGEIGPELFVPSAPGTILPASLTAALSGIAGTGGIGYDGASLLGPSPAVQPMFAAPTSAVAGAGRGGDTFIIHNPLPERASESQVAILRRRAVSFQGP